MKTCTLTQRRALYFPLASLDLKIQVEFMHSLQDSGCSTETASAMSRITAACIPCTEPSVSQKRYFGADAFEILEQVADEKTGEPVQSDTNCPVRGGSTASADQTDESTASLCGEERCIVSVGKGASQLRVVVE